MKRKRDIVGRESPKNIADRIGRPVKVLQIIAGVGMGGLEKQMLAFLQRYDRRRFAVDVCCTGSTEGPLREKFLAAQTRLFYCRWSRYVFPFVWRLVKLLRRERYDVVHARMAEVSGAAILAARIVGVPVPIASYHHTQTWENPGLFKRLIVGLLQRATRRWATRILGISRATLDAYFRDWGGYPAHFTVCYNGIDMDRFSVLVDPAEVRAELGIPIDAMVVGNVGGFREVKNHRTFVDIAKKVAEKRENVYFLLVGDGELRATIESEVMRRGMGDRFVFAGIRHDIPRVLAAMDVFLMPSLHEGFATVVVEAQAAGVPVVASDLSSIREALCAEMQELCCGPRDADGMACQIISLLNAPERISRLAQIGREYVAKTFSIQRTVEQLQCVYTEDVIVSNGMTSD